VVLARVQDERKKSPYGRQKNRPINHIRIVIAGISGSSMLDTDANFRKRVASGYCSGLLVSEVSEQWVDGGRSMAWALAQMEDFERARLRHCASRLSARDTRKCKATGMTARPAISI
jgi:hypothetical protein